jgi:hypothetical protein
MPEKSDSYEPGRVSVPDATTVRRPARGDAHPTAELPEVASPDEVDTGTGWPDRDPVEQERPARRPSRGADYDYDREPKGRRGGCLFWLAGMVALLVVLALGAKLTGLWPHFHNPFAAKKTDRSQPTLLLSIQDLSRFTAASGNFQVIIDVQKDRKYIPDVVFSDRTLFVAAGSVDTFVDFSAIGSGAIKDSADHKSAEIRLPAPALEPANLDQTKSYVYAEQRGLWNRITSVFSDNPNRMQELYRYGVQKINEAALQSDLAKRAAENTRKMLEQLLRSLGYTTVTVIFANP